MKNSNPTAPPKKAELLLPAGNLEKLKIPLPPLEVQKQIVKSIVDEEKKISTLKEEVRSIEQKVKSKIAEVWGE